MRFDTILDNYIPINNLVLVKPDADNDKLILGNDKILYLSTVHEPLKHATTAGTVVRVPEKLNYTSSITSTSIDFDTDMELQVGDKIIYHYLTASNNKTDNNIIDVGGEKYLQVKYDRIYCAIRNDEIIMLNGYVLVEPEEEYSFGHDGNPLQLILPQSSIKYSQTKGYVRHIGTPLRAYRDFPQEGADEDYVAVGDYIVFKSLDAIPLQYQMHQVIYKDKILYRMHRRDVLGVLVDAGT